MKPLWVDGAPARTYGAMNCHNQPAIAAVLHTTETSGMPNYGGGDTAPHHTYDPLTRTFYAHAPFTEYVGTLKGHTNGGHGNCKAVQLEIIAYSDKAVADANPARLWIGDLSEDGYADVAEWVEYVRDATDVGAGCTPTPAGGWLYGTSSPLRMNSAEWAEFNGLTAHGAVPLNTHWDTGVLDLVKVSDYMPAPPVNGDTMDTETWARTLRNPLDFDRMAAVGIITVDERDYWVTVDPANVEEFQYLRNAVDVRATFWA